MRSLLIRAAVLGLFISLPSQALAPPIPRIPIFRPPAIRPVPAPIPRSMPTPGVRSPGGVDPVLVPGMTHPWQFIESPAIRQARITSEINALARSNPHEAVLLLKRERLLLTIDQRVAAEATVTEGLATHAEATLRAAPDPWDGFNAVNKALTQAKSLEQPVLLKADAGIGPIANLAKGQVVGLANPKSAAQHARLEKLLREASDRCIKTNMEEAVHLASQGNWKGAGQAAGRRLGELKGNAERLDTLVEFRQMQAHLEVIEQLGRARWLGHTGETLPAEMNQLSRGLKSADALQPLVKGPVGAQFSAKTFQSHVDQLVLASGEKELGHRLGRETATRAYLEGNPAEGLKLLRLSKPLKGSSADALACEQILRDMQHLVIGEGTVQSAPVTQALGRLGDGVAPPRGPPQGLRPLIPEGSLEGYRVPIRDGIAQDLPSLTGELGRVTKAMDQRLGELIATERILVERAKPSILHMARAVLHGPGQAPPKVLPAAKEQKQEPEEDLTDEQLIQFLEARLGPLNAQQRQRALELKRQGRRPLQILFALHGRRP